MFLYNRYRACFSALFCLRHKKYGCTALCNITYGINMPMRE